MNRKDFSIVSGPSPIKVEDQVTQKLYEGFKIVSTHVALHGTSRQLEFVVFMVKE
jgi:hypothetical protein